MIFLRTTSVDNNEAAAQSRFVSIPCPIGVQDGDLLVVALSVLNGDAVEITPPDGGWTRVLRTEPLYEPSLAVYWKFALNEGSRWVFALGSPEFGQGLALVYGGADGWEPVEAYSTTTSTFGVTQNIAAVSTSVNDEEVVAFVAANGESALTPPANYTEIAHRQNTGTISASRRAVAAAGPQIATTATLASAANGAAARIVLRPSASRLALDDVRRLLVGALPADADRVYDLDPGGDYYKLFQAIALTAKQVIFDLVELCQLEILPRFARYKLPDWERVFGLTTTRAAQVGTVPARQAQVVSRWREAAGLGSTRDAITAILGPLLGYNAATPVETVVTDRALLKIEHSYQPTAAITVADGNVSARYTFTTVDGGFVSSAGARVTLEYGLGAGTGEIECSLYAPDGTLKVWTVELADGQALDLLFGAEFAGKTMFGPWQVWVENNSGASLTFIPTVFVEGVSGYPNIGQETAAAMFDWGVYADPAHLSESGVPADFAAARQAVQRIAFDHTVGNLLQSLAPYPDEDSGLHAAIPDEVIPTA